MERKWIRNITAFRTTERQRKWGGGCADRIHGREVSTQTPRLWHSQCQHKLFCPMRWEKNMALCPLTFFCGFLLPVAHVSSRPPCSHRGYVGTFTRGGRGGRQEEKQQIVLNQCWLPGRHWNMQRAHLPHCHGLKDPSFRHAISCTPKVTRQPVVIQNNLQLLLLLPSLPSFSPLQVFLHGSSGQGQWTFRWVIAALPSLQK